ncbi:dihydroorotase [Robiginitalea marina]|uniref:Dihydroorotase n=1 Tax=Robiginitalea marina TaxID=2954105 RepID=A0ABT1AUF7_9FLAO|nr:dihydroorotase [Robiginitalea marina]MCO5723621.1 dihydroorotase [Robiginitalea marina]
MNLLIKSATLIDPTQPALHLKKRDLLIEKGQIRAIGTGLREGGNTRVIRLENLFVSPGWFDSGVSFGEPGFEERETIANGLKVAAASGFAGVVLNTNTNPTPDTSGDIVFLKDAARGQVSELFPMGTLSVKSRGEDLSEMHDMHQAGAVGFSDYKTPLENPNLLKLALLYVQHFGGLAHSFPMDAQVSAKGQVHEGNVSVTLGLKGIPALAEELRIARDLALLEYTGGRLHIPTISSAHSVALIASAKKKGLDVSCSVAIHNLWFTEESLEGFDSRFKVLPPLRSQRDVKALRKALKEGVIDFVTTDHCPMDIEEKRKEFDLASFGTVGLEGAFGVLNQIFGTEASVEILTRGRERFGLRRPVLKEGEKAVLTLFNPEQQSVLEADTLLSSSKNAIFLGVPLVGKAYGVIVGERNSL